MRGPHVLKTLVKGLGRMRFIFFDVETKTAYEEDGKMYQEMRLLTANMVNYIPGKSFTVADTLQEKNPDYFRDWVVWHAKPRQILYVLSANIWFDIRNSGLFVGLMHDKWEIKLFHCRGWTNIIKLKKGPLTLMFLNMQQLIPVSVKAYGDMVGLEKMDMNVHFWDDKAIMEYCQRDTDIITKVFSQWLDFVYRHDLGKFSFTLASQAFTAYRHRFMSEKINIHRCDWLTRFERECYYGGRTEIFYQGRIPEGKIYGLDVNSMYPYVMKEYTMPVRWVGSHKLPPVWWLTYFLYRYCCMAWCALDTPEPVYPKRIQKKLCFPTGKFLTYLTHSELEYAYKHKHIKGIYMLILYKKRIIFDDYVDYFHDLKNKYQKEENEAYRFMTKRMMNSLYGKFGQKVDKLFFEEEMTEERYHHETVVDGDTGIRYKELWLGKKRTVYEESASDAGESLVAIPAHITGCARMYLWELICKAGRENVYYCDTDSLFVSGIGYERLKGKIHPGKLGALELEKESDNVTIWGPKDYEFAGKVCIKGVKKGTKQQADGGYAQLQFPGFRSDLSAGLDKPYAIKKLTKYLKRKYTKGIVLPSGRVTPFKLSEF